MPGWKGRSIKWWSQNLLKGEISGKSGKKKKMVVREEKGKVGPQ